MNRPDRRGRDLNKHGSCPAPVQRNVRRGRGLSPAVDGSRSFIWFSDECRE